MVIMAPIKYWKLIDMSTFSLNKIIEWHGDVVVDSRREGVIGINDFQQPWFLRLGWERSKFVALIPNMGSCLS